MNTILKDFCLTFLGNFFQANPIISIVMLESKKSIEGKFIYENEAIRLVSNYELTFTQLVMNDYKYCNVKRELEFYPDFRLKYFYNILAPKINKHVKYTEVYSYESFVDDPEKVLLCFSGGLDSVYQAMKLREKGYEVYLLHISNMNAYTNGQELKIVQQFAEKNNFKLFVVNFTAFNKKDNPWRKEFQENPVKDLLFYSIAIDYGKLFGIKNISSGDDLRLELKDAITDTNIGDAKELTEAIFKGFPEYNFIPVEKSTKADRLAYLEKLNLKDEYYSCVGPGRLNQYLHESNSKKFNVTLDKYVCGSCRKCCSHVWYDYIFNHKTFPQDFLEHCWSKMSIGADAEFFKNAKTLEERKQALLNY